MGQKFRQGLGQGIVAKLETRILQAPRHHPLAVEQQFIGHFTQRQAQGNARDRQVYPGNAA